MRFFNATGGWSTLTSGLGCQLLSGGFASRTFTSSLLSTSHNYKYVFSLGSCKGEMSDESAAVTATPAAATPKKKAKSAAKKPKTAPSHPKVSEMVNDAITSLKERGGSSAQAIKKHISAHHKVDIDRLTPFIKKYLKSAVAGGTLVQTKGKGASGSFKLSASGQKTKEPSKVKKAKKEGATPAKKAKSATKKAAKPKAKSAEKKKPAAKKPSAKKAAKPKSPKKATKPSKPKAPKVKKMKTPKKASPKKAAKK